MNTFLYYIGRFVMPLAGFIFNMCTLLLLYNYTYYFFFCFNDLRMYYALLDLEKRNLTISYILEGSTCYEINDTGYDLVLWHREGLISVHDSKTRDCILGTFSASKWDRKLNETIYNLFK